MYTHLNVFIIFFWCISFSFFALINHFRLFGFSNTKVTLHFQKYIKVLSRPLALMKAKHKVWSPVYIDYVTEQSDIRVPSSRPADLHMDFEKETGYEYEVKDACQNFSIHFIIFRCKEECQ